MGRESMVKDTLVFLLAGGQGERLSPLTRDRAKPAVPFGGQYRIIDFTLTNCIHSGLRRVFVLTQYRSLSLERHVKRGYSFLSRELDEYIDSVPPQFRTASRWYSGTADAVYQNIYLLERDRPSRTLILSGDHVYRLDYRDMVRDHQERNAGMTIGVIEVPLEEATRMGVLEVDEDFRVVGFEEKPENPKPIPGHPDLALASMGIYLFETDILVKEISWDAKRESSHDFGKDIVPHMVERGAPIYAFPFRDSMHDRPAYWRDVGTIDAYFDAHRDILGNSPAFDIRDPAWEIFSVQPRLPSAEFRTAGGRAPEVVDSIVSSGGIISGASVTRSVLGPAVEVEEGAIIEDSILLGRTKIGKGVRLKSVIVDRDAQIGDGVVVGVDPENDARGFVRSPGGITVIPGRIRVD